MRLLITCEFSDGTQVLIKDPATEADYEVLTTAQDGDDEPGDVEHDLGLAPVGAQDRFLDDRDRACSTAEAAVRVRHDATSSQTGCLRDRGFA